MAAAASPACTIVTVPAASLGPVAGYLLPSREPLLAEAIMAAFDLE